MASTIDLTDTPGHETSIVPKESPEVQAARLLQEAADARLRRWKDGVLFAVTLVVVLALLIGCAGIAFNFFGLGAGASVDDKKWAMSALTLGLGGMIGFLLRPSK